jgi:hypothetical protein
MNAKSKIQLLLGLLLTAAAFFSLILLYSIHWSIPFFVPALLGAAGIALLYYPSWSSLIFFEVLYQAFLWCMRLYAETAGIGYLILLVVLLAAATWLAPRFYDKVEDAAEDRHGPVYLNKDKRRYTALILHGGGSKNDPAEAILTGTVKPGDRVLVYPRLDQPQYAHIEAIFLDHVSLPEAKDGSFFLVFQDLKKPLSTFSTLASFLPDITHPHAFENPELEGLLAADSACFMEAEFFNSFVVTLVHSPFLAQAHVHFSFPGQKEYSFDYLKEKNGTAPARVLPLFTSPVYFPSSKTPHAANVHGRALILTFQDAVKIFHTHQEHLDGILINPGTPHSIYLSQNLLRRIIRLPAYMEEFGVGDPDEYSFSRPKSKKS